MECQGATTQPRLEVRTPSPTPVGATVDRLVHHAEVIVLEGASYRLKDRARRWCRPSHADRAVFARAADTATPAQFRPTLTRRVGHWRRI